MNIGQIHIERKTKKYRLHIAENSDHHVGSFDMSQDAQNVCEFSEICIHIKSIKKTCLNLERKIVQQNGVKVILVKFETASNRFNVSNILCSSFAVVKFAILNPLHTKKKMI